MHLGQGADLTARGARQPGLAPEGTRIDRDKFGIRCHPSGCGLPQARNPRRHRRVKPYHCRQKPRGCRQQHMGRHHNLATACRNLDAIVHKAQRAGAGVEVNRASGKVTLQRVHQRHHAARKAHRRRRLQHPRIPPRRARPLFEHQVARIRLRKNLHAKVPKEGRKIWLHGGPDPRRAEVEAIYRKDAPPQPVACLDQAKGYPRAMKGVGGNQTSQTVAHNHNRFPQGLPPLHARHNRRSESLRPPSGCLISTLPRHILIRGDRRILR
jgi:hypothetical protein